jgi:TctA family transporter
MLEVAQHLAGGFADLVQPANAVALVVGLVVGMLVAVLPG